MRASFLAFILLLIFINPHQAQDNCPTLEQAAIAEASVWCSDVLVDNACIGNADTVADLTQDAITFQNIGDTAPLTAITQLTTGIDRDNSAWGIAKIVTLSHRPDSWRSQVVTIILLGQAHIENLGQDGIDIMSITTSINVSAGANIRRRPDADAPLIQTARQGDFVKIVGRSADNLWYQVQLLDGALAWVVSDAVALADATSLPVMDDTAEAVALLYRPFTDMRIDTGTQSACEGASPEGIFIQGEDLVEGVLLRINGYDIILRGTVFIQSDERATAFYITEGDATIDGRDVEGGQFIRLGAEDAQLRPYDVGTLSALPTNLHPRFAYLAVDTSAYLTPRPNPDRSPLADILVDEPCRFTTGESGANLRAGPGVEYPIQGVMAYRESASPIGRITMGDGTRWWEIAPYLWVRSDTTVTGGDCINVPESSKIPPPPPVIEEETPQSS